ncbi:MAG: methyltransferase domain-containing protein [Acidobacteriota bacterium]|nr:methyltransferase domain-containing protein [Acidobacteriota bacterium]
MTDTQQPREPFIPALRFSQLTRFYDAVVRFTTHEDRFRAALVEEASIQPGQRVLDLGCGTASSAILAKRVSPCAEIIGVDADARVLSLARRKISAAGLEIELRQGVASALPFADGTFDKVISSLLFHHLNTFSKLQALRECLRVLRDGGELFVADWGKPRTPAAKLGFAVVRALDGFNPTRDNAEGRLPDLIEEAGFSHVKSVRSKDAPAGTIVLIRASRAR